MFTSQEVADILSLPSSFMLCIRRATSEDDVRSIRSVLLNALKCYWQKIAIKHHPDYGGKAEDFERVREAYDQATTEEWFLDVWKASQKTASRGTTDSGVFELKDPAFIRRMRL